MADQGEAGGETVAVLGAGSTMGFAMARNMLRRRDREYGPGTGPPARRSR